MKVKKPYFSVYQAPATAAASSFSPGCTSAVTSTVSCTSRSRYAVHPGARTSSETGVPFTCGSATPSAVHSSSARATSSPRTKRVRVWKGCAAREGDASPTGSAIHSPSARNPAVTAIAGLQAVDAPAVERTRTETSRRSPAVSGENGQATSTLSAVSRVTVSMPSLTSAERCRQPSGASETCHVRRGVAVATTSESSRSSARR